MNTQKVHILYERLSVDDEKQGPSNSIINQQQLLAEFAECNGLIPYIHVVDDGYSGTNWNRPGWQEIIAKIEANEVVALVVKDSSRMGRDYLRVGLYREMFREKGVRLIAVNDGIDSDRGDDDFTPFREIMAEYYARDTSRKVKSVKQAKGRSGKPLAGNPPYGYMKDPNDKNHWLPDPEAGTIVKRIFNIALEGNGPMEIARQLTADKVECPSYYLGSRQRGNYQNTYDKDKPYAWWYSMVQVILARVEYCGHTVNFRTSKTSYKSKHVTKNPQEEWLIFENTHEPIITQETFDTVQKLRGTPRRQQRHGEPHPLTGLIFCADCGSKLYNQRGNPYLKKYSTGHTCMAKPQDTYECSKFKLYQKGSGDRCSSHHIRTEAVKEIILDVLKRTSGYVREHEAEFVDLVRQQSAFRNGESAKLHHKQITKNERRIAELDKLIVCIYEDKVKGLLPEERFVQMAANYEQEQASLKQQTAALQNELEAFNADSMRADKFVELVRRYTQFDTLTGSMIAEFIDKIVIHEAEWSENDVRYRGIRTQAVEVYLNYIGKFDAPDLRTAEEIEAERITLEKAERSRTQHREAARRYRERQKQKTQTA